MGLTTDDPNIDLGCIDYNMPERNDFELVEPCRLTRLSLSIILNSDLAIDFDREAIQHAETREIINKPVNQIDR